MQNNESNQGQNGYKEIQQINHVKALLKRFGVRKYTDANRKYKILATIASYGFNIISILLAFKGLVWLLSWMIDSETIRQVITLFTLVLVELGKRWSSDEVWDAYESRKVLLKLPLCMLLLFFLVSGVSTGGGAYLEVIRLSEGKANVIVEAEDPELVSIQSRLDSIDNMVNTMSNTRWKGTVTQDANKNIQLMLPTQTTLIAARLTRKGQIFEHNQLALSNHNISVGWIALAVFFLCLFFEGAFEGTMWYQSHYDFKSLCEQLGKEQAIELFTINEDEAMITYLNTPKTAPLQVAQQEGQQRKIGFQQRHSLKETTAQPTVSTSPKQSKTIVAQQEQPVPVPKKQADGTDRKLIVSAPSEDVSKWRKYAGVYYKRAMKPIPENLPATERNKRLATKQRNLETYQEYWSLLEATGKFDKIEGEYKLSITEKIK